LSSGLAAPVLGWDRWEFYRLLTEYGFSVLDDGEDEQAYEADTSREMASRRNGLVIRPSPVQMLNEWHWNLTQKCRYAWKGRTTKNTRDMRSGGQDLDNRIKEGQHGDTGQRLVASSPA